MAIMSFIMKVISPLATRDATSDETFSQKFTSITNENRLNVSLGCYYLEILVTTLPTLQIYHLPNLNIRRHISKHSDQSQGMNYILYKYSLEIILITLIDVKFPPFTDPFGDAFADRRPQATDHRLKIDHPLK